MKTKLRNRLSIKLIVAISIILIIILSIYTYISIANLDDYLTSSSIKNAYNISEVIKKSTRYSMLLDRSEDVHQIIKTIGTEEGVKGIRIYNKQGIIIFSTDSTELLKRVDVTAEACIGCHNSNVPLSTLSNKNKTRIFTLPNDERILGLINPINNDEDCYSADCHAHPPQIQFLGVLDVMLSLRELDAVKAETARTTILNSAIITVVTAVACGIFIILLINIPIKKLYKGIEEVGKGNLNYKITVDSEDEIGKMAKRFNEMSLRLNEAYESIKNWSETLNEKVNQKTEELKNIYNQVNQIEKLASLGKLSATVAHELNNPLEGILTYSKLISKKLKNGQNNGDHNKLITYLDLISGESARCGKIVKDLLLFSHRDNDEFVQDDLVKIVNKSIAMINHHLDMNRIKLEKEFCAGEVMIFCNPHKIQQTIMSLLINAIESMTHPGKIKVRIDKDENNIFIRIKDEGSGISDKDLPHIFEPFYSTKEVSKGTGLGLAVSYGIVTSHNGRIEVEETSSDGTTFLITLPLNNPGGFNE